MKQIEKMNFIELKNEAKKRGVFDPKASTSSMKSAVQKHREDNPDFVLTDKVIEPTVNATKETKTSDAKDGSPAADKMETGLKESKTEKTKEMKKDKKIKAAKPVKKAKVKKAKAEKKPVVKKASKKVATKKAKAVKKVSAPNVKTKNDTGISIKDTVLKLHKDGKTLADIAKSTGFKPKTIHEAIYKNNILSSFDKGKTAKEISEKFGYGMKPVQAHIKKYRTKK